MFLSKMQTLPFEGHNVAYQCVWVWSKSEGQGHNACLWNGLELSNILCEYEVNRLTNEKVIKAKWNLNASC